MAGQLSIVMLPMILPNRWMNTNHIRKYESNLTLQSTPAEHAAFDLLCANKYEGNEPCAKSRLSQQHLAVKISRLSIAGSNFDFLCKAQLIQTRP